MSIIAALETAPVKSKRKVDQLLATLSTPEEEVAVLDALRDAQKWDADTLARVLTNNSSVKVSASSVRRYRMDVLGMDK